MLTNLLAENCRAVRLWIRNEELARSVATSRINTNYFPPFKFNEKVQVVSSLSDFFEGGLSAIFFVVPSGACRSLAQSVAPYLKGNEIIFHAIKGVEPKSMLRMSEILNQELPCRRVGVVSGPNLALEIMEGQPTATVVASSFLEVREAGRALLEQSHFKVFLESDLIGVEWAGSFKNILAISVGALDAMGLGYNARALLMTQGLLEMATLGVILGAKRETFLGLAGTGDLFATCSSPLSRNYCLGNRLGKGEKLDDILQSLKGTVEGLVTVRSVRHFVQTLKMNMPITECIFQLIEGNSSAQEMMDQLFK